MLAIVLPPALFFIWPGSLFCFLSFSVIQFLLPADREAWWIHIIIIMIAFCQFNLNWTCDIWSKLEKQFLIIMISPLPFIDGLWNALCYRHSLGNWVTQLSRPYFCTQSTTWLYSLKDYKHYPCLVLRVVYMF